MKELIYVVDDEPDILELVSIHLKKAHYRAESFANAETFLRALKKNKPDLIILDLMLPDAEGMEICKHIKQSSQCASPPIIMLTARSDEADRVLGLELGADDYVTKPFSPRELVARVKAVLRRGVEVTTKDKIRVGDFLIIDIKKYDVVYNGKKIDLTSTEFNILKLLAQRKGWVFSRKQLLDLLWESNKIVVDRTIDVHIRNLRKKLGSAAVYIKNVRGVGYKLIE
jgi:two-component system phosphate regulon response regulator PhoB/two-component system alkaline phosphatase synthesis response regulator PhoP